MYGAVVFDLNNAFPAIYARDLIFGKLELLGLFIFTLNNKVDSGLIKYLIMNYVGLMLPNQQLLFNSKSINSDLRFVF